MRNSPAAVKNPKWEIVPLKGRYCIDCVQSIRQFRLAMYAIIPMCHEDLDQLLHNGDMEIIRRLMEDKMPEQNESIRFSYVKYDPESIQKQELFKKKFEELEAIAYQTLPDSRARSLFLTSLEEAYMWTGKAIRDEQIARGAQPAHVPERSAE